MNFRRHQSILEQSFVHSRHLRSQGWRFASLRPLGKGRNCLARSVSQTAGSGLSIVRLKESIQAAIDEEDYEAAARFRDELREKEDDAHSAVEEANRMFYVAFEQTDLKMMERIWGRGDHVQCLHPLTPCIAGHEHVIDGWRMILQGIRNVQDLKIMVKDVRIHVGEDQAFVTCIEIMEGEASSGRTAATNVFERQNGEWKIIHHQGGPVSTDI